MPDLEEFAAMDPGANAFVAILSRFVQPKARFCTRWGCGGCTRFTTLAEMEELQKTFGH
jgi:hypothetical protein